MVIIFYGNSDLAVNDVHWTWSATTRFLRTKDFPLYKTFNVSFGFFQKLAFKKICNNRSFYQNWCSWGCSKLPLSLITWLRESSFSWKSSKHLHSQTVRARKLKFLENFHFPPCVTCHMSHVICAMSCVINKLNFFFSEKVVQLDGRGSVTGCDK